MQQLDYAKMGARIQQIRKAKGWSQDILAKRCGISLNFVSHIERGTRKMSMDTFVTICRELETNADTLLWGMTEHSEAQLRGMWKGTEPKDEDSYSMYLKIMKSVADIMSSKPSLP